MRVKEQLVSTVEQLETKRQVFDLGCGGAQNRAKSRGHVTEITLSPSQLMILSAFYTGLTRLHRNLFVFLQYQQFSFIHQVHIIICVKELYTVR